MDANNLPFAVCFFETYVYAPEPELEILLSLVTISAFAVKPITAAFLSELELLD